MANRQFERDAPMLCSFALCSVSANHSVCYTLTGSLEWVGRLLALVFPDFRFQVSGFEIHGI